MQEFTEIIGGDTPAECWCLYDVENNTFPAAFQATNLTPSLQLQLNKSQLRCEAPRDNLAVPPQTLLHYEPFTEQISGVQPHCSRMIVFRPSAYKEDAAESERERIYGTVLVQFGIIQMSRHVVLLAVVIYDHWLWNVSLVAIPDEV